MITIFDNFFIIYRRFVITYGDISRHTLKKTEIIFHLKNKK